MLESQSAAGKAAVNAVWLGEVSIYGRVTDDYVGRVITWFENVCSR